jgi:hypothetical protein
VGSARYEAENCLRFKRCACKPLHTSQLRSAIRSSKLFCATGGMSMQTNEPYDLEHAIARLQEALAAGSRLDQSVESLIQLQAAIEAAGRAVRDERWARENYVFQGE